MSKQIKVLVAGASGALASRILTHLSNKPNVKAVGLVRNLSKAPKIENVSFVEADIQQDDDRLKKSLEGVTTVVSAVQGGQEVIVQGQTNLLKAAIAQGVTKFIPSDFSIDLFNIEKDEHIFLSLRRQFAEVLAKSGIPQYQHILNGAFMEVTFGFFGIYNKDLGTVSYYGSENQPMDFTTYDDTAKYTAEVAVDFDLPNGPFHVAADVRSIKQLADDYEAVKGKKLTLVNKGTTDDLKALIAKLQKEHGWNNIYAYVPQMYQLPMMDGRGKLKPQNSRYPQIKPQSWKEFLQTANEAKDW